nr:hypothetical protein [Tanacetum cinerariifolium]
MRLQALVDKKKVVVTEATIRDALRLMMQKPVEVFDPYHTAMKQVGDLSTHTTKYTSAAVTQKVFANMRRVGKGFSTVETSLFEGMIVEQQVAEALKRRVENLELDKIAQALEITKLKQRVKKLERRNKLKEGIIKNIDAYEDVVLEDAKDVDAKDNQDIEVLSMQDEEESEPIKLQEVVDVVTTTKIITAASTTITAADVPTPATTTAVAFTLIAAPSRRRKGVVIRDPKESTTTSTIIHSEAKTKDKARKNMMVYLKNVAGFKMDYFKEMSYDDIHPIFEKHFDSNMAFLQKTKEQMDEEDSKALKRLNESKAKKAAKKQKLDEEVKELKRHLQIVPNDDDDVYTEVTPLARKVLFVDYEIYNENNKPYFKIKRADGTHQLYISFLSMLKNFDREDLEVLWQLVKERFATKCSWSSKSQELEAVGILWCADYYIHNNTVDFAGREEISTHKVHSKSDA